MRPEAPPREPWRAGRGAGVSAAAALAAATVCATALDTAGRLAGAVPVTIYQIVLAAGLAALMWALVTERLCWRRTPLDLPLALFLGAVLAATATGSSFGVDLLTLAKIASSVALYLLIVQAARKRGERDLIISALLLTVGLSGTYALVARLTGLTLGITKGVVARTSGTFDDPNIFGTVLVLGLAVGGALWMEEPRWRRPWILAFVPTTLGALLFTFSRGAAVAAVVAALAILVGSRRPLATKATVVVLALAVGVVAFSALVPPEFVTQKILGAGDDPSATGRVYMWRSSLAMARANPLGVGPGGFPKAYPAFRLQGTAAGLVESHNGYLTLLTEMGLVGLLAMLMLAARFGGTLARVLRGPSGEARALALGAAAAAAAIAVQATTYSLEFSKPLWITFALGVSAYITASEAQGPDAA